MWIHLSDNAEISFDPQLLEQIEQKKDKEIETILQKEKDLCSAIDISGASLLHYAAEFGNDVITTYLITSGSSINLQDKNGNTPLSLATKSQHVDRVDILLQYEADIYICDNDGTNPLQLSLQSIPTNIEIAKLFLKRVSNECSSDITEIAKKLIKIGCPFPIAVLLENIDVTMCMLSEGSYHINDGYPYKTALHFAVKNADLAHVEKLVYHGADVNLRDQGRTPLLMLEDFRKPDEALSIIKILLREKTNLSFEGCGQLRSMFEKGTKNIVKIMLESLPDVTIRDCNGENILYYLVRNPNKGIVGVIEDLKLTDKLNVNDRDNLSLTVLHHAMKVGNSIFVEYLIENGANVHVASYYDGVTPFLSAVNSTSEFGCEYKRARCVKILLMNKARPDFFLGQYFKIHDTKSAIIRDFVLLEPVVAMLVLWKAVNKAFNREILGKIESHPKLKEYFDKCMEELERMKKDRAYGSVSVFDILADNDNARGTKGSVVFCMSMPWLGRVINKYHSIGIYYEILCDRTDEMIDENFTIATSFVILVCVIFFIIYFYLCHKFWSYMTERIREQEDVNL